LPTESDQCDIKRVLLGIGLEHDRNAMTTPSVTDQPSVEGGSKPHARTWVCCYFGKKSVNLIETARRRRDVALRRLNDVIDELEQVALDQRVTD
jgi:hypothetical protein